jgi:hypothetical protein
VVFRKTTTKSTTKADAPPTAKNDNKKKQRQKQMALPLQAFAMPGGGFAAFLEGCAYRGFGGGSRLWDIFRRAKKPYAPSERQRQRLFFSTCKALTYLEAKTAVDWVICRYRGS